MALTDENNGGLNLSMPVAPAYGNGGFGFGNDGSWWLILFLFAMFGGWGNGFGGGFGGDGLYPWMNQSNQMNNGFRDQMLNSSIQGIQSAINSGFGDVQLGIAGINQNLCQTGNGIVNALNSGFSAAEIAANARQMADMQQAFNSQTAITGGLTNLSAQLAQCCCDNRLATAQTQAIVQSENCADRQALSDGIRDVIAATQAQTQTILTQLCNDKIEQKNDTINQLRSELLYARGQASQDVQTAAIQAGQRALANEVEQYVSPKAIPAYLVQNPSCCYQGACGCGA